MIFRKRREHRRAAKRHRRLSRRVLDIAYKYRNILPSHVTRSAEEYFREGEGALALEDILYWLYESQVEPTAEERQTLVEMAESEKTFERDYLIFWPDLHPDITPTFPDMTKAREALLSCMTQLIQKGEHH